MPAEDGAGLGTAAIYVVPNGLNVAESVRLALARLARVAGRVLVVCHPDDLDWCRPLAGEVEGVGIEVAGPGRLTPMLGYRAGLLALRRAGRLPGAVLLGGSHVFGPVAGRLPPPPGPGGADLTAPYWHDPALDTRFAGNAQGRVAYPDFAWIGPRLLADGGFWDFWDGLTGSGDGWRDFLAGPARLAALLEQNGFHTSFPMPPEALTHADPRLFELDAALAGGAWAVPVDVLVLDPLLHDLNATDLRRALDRLRAEDPELFAAMMAFVARHVPQREFATIAGQYEVIDGHPADPGKNAWSFGEVAVFVHAYYPEMMPEFWELSRRLPCRHRLFITTATEAKAEEIRSFLGAEGCAPEAHEVRVVGQNRGRDMSSLFITWRDVVLSGRYEVALRLHSKRTPQVSPQVGRSFKAHLFENLVPGPGHVRQILDRIEAEPDIGLVIPPVIHVGFGTLGHAWWNNRAPVADLARRMGLAAPLDHATPVTAYGTMYWFRTEALRRMFEWPWRWEDYSPEPHHVDGGLAHVQERLIGLCVQASGFRTWQVMTPEAAARGYAWLEYKLQMLASYLGSNVILHQRAELARRSDTLRGRLYRGLREGYGAVLRRFPAARPWLRRFEALIRRVLSAQ